MTTSLLQIGTVGQDAIIVQVEHAFPLTPEYLARNRAVVVDPPSEANGWATGECSCDVDYRCGNHDTDAEAAFHWNGHKPKLTEDEILDSYEAGDPKRYALLGELE